MRVRAWSAILATPSGLPGGPTAPAIDLPCNNSLAALRNMDVLHCHHLTTAGSHALQREQARLVGCRQPSDGAGEAADFLVPLPFLGSPRRGNDNGNCISSIRIVSFMMERCRTAIW